MSSSGKTKEKDLAPEHADHDSDSGSEDHSEEINHALHEATVSAALEQMEIRDVIQGESGIGEMNKNDTGSHKFGATQPVPQLGEEVIQEDGYIEPSKPPEEVPQDPYPLPKDFVWSTLDLTDVAQLQELYELLSANYVEDDDALFRFQYSAEFLKWALQPPGYIKEWHVGVRAASNNELIAFISAVPMSIRVRENLLRAGEMNFLCVHKNSRSKRLTPVLIDELHRQCNLTSVFQRFYTVNDQVLLPTHPPPVSKCRYNHRCLNIPKLVNIGFTDVPFNMTLEDMIHLHKVSERPRLLDHGMREMQEKDVAQVSDLFAQYMKRFGMTPELTSEEVRHHFLSGRGEGPGGNDSWKNPRESQVIWAYVIENPATHKITDFFSFYSLPFSIIGNTEYDVLNAAYLYYYATDVAFEDGAEENGELKRRLEDLIGDALIVADQAKFDVFNALSLMDNVLFMEDLKFGVGDGLLNYYLFNWRTAPLAGLYPVDGVSAGKGIGIVMI